jgi:hypothetical protein
MSYVYVRSESQLYTVGFYNPNGKWEPESDHTTIVAAAKRVHFLNGGVDLDLLELRSLIVAAAKRRLTIRFDGAEVSESGGYGVLYSDTGNDPVQAFIDMIKSIEGIE